jgi:hypothetical protein
MRRTYPTGKIMVIIILTALIAGNAVWSLASGRSAPWIAVAAYGAVALAVLKSKDYRAGLIAGIAGFLIHAVELAVRGTTGLGQLERVWLSANMILPLALAWSSRAMIPRSRGSIDGTDRDKSGGASGDTGRRE